MPRRCCTWSHPLQQVRQPLEQHLGRLLSRQFQHLPGPQPRQPLPGQGLVINPVVLLFTGAVGGFHFLDQRRQQAGLQRLAIQAQCTKFQWRALVLQLQLQQAFGPAWLRIFRVRWLTRSAKSMFGA